MQPAHISPLLYTDILCYGPDSKHSWLNFSIWMLEMTIVAWFQLNLTLLQNKIDQS